MIPKSTSMFSTVSELPPTTGGSSGHSILTQTFFKPSVTVKGKSYCGPFENNMTGDFGLIRPLNDPAVAESYLT